MGIHYFTDEQVKELEKNSYVKKVSNKAITYTKEFREEFYIRYSNSQNPSIILRELGFSTNVLGKSRIKSITERIKKQSKRTEIFSDKRKDGSGRPRIKEMIKDEEIAYLKHKIEYQKQEIEVLKNQFHQSQSAMEETTIEKFKLIQKMISRDNTLLNITWLGDIAGVSRSGYYNWIKNKDKREEKDQKDKKDFDLILEAYKYRSYKKGEKNIHMHLLHKGIRMNVKKIRRIMKKFGLFCPVRKVNPYRRMAKALKTDTVADNIVNRDFEQ